MRKISLTLFFLFSIYSYSVLGQELNIKVQVSAPRLQTVDPKVFETLEREISEFLNNTRWTDDEFENFEKIEGNLNLTIVEELSPTSFFAELYIQTVRPVFSSNYKTQVLNILDNQVSFSYTELQPLENSYNSYTDNLSSILTYYVYIMLGFDYDTFSPLGGDQYFQVAKNIVSQVPPGAAGSGSGWESLSTDRNRYWLVENIFNPRIRPLRQAAYELHRLSLDTMSEDADRAKAILVSALTTIEQVNRSYPNTMIVQMFSDSKRDEIIEIFKGASRGQQSKVYDIMVSLDPAQASRYSEIK